MASEVSICNGALDHLGATRISALSDNSRNAKACNAAYERVRDSLLRKHKWNFAITRVQLAADSTAPDFGYENQYTLPTDCLRTLEKDDGYRYTGEVRIVEGRKIVTNESAPLDLRYVKQVTDPNEMDPIFREVLSLDLALAMCEEITQSNTKKADIREERKLQMAEARRTNAIEQDPAEAPEDDWITVRR